MGHSVYPQTEQQIYGSDHKKAAVDLKLLQIFGGACDQTDSRILLKAVTQRAGNLYAHARKKFGGLHLIREGNHSDALRYCPEAVNLDCDQKDHAVSYDHFHR